MKKLTLKAVEMSQIKTIKEIKCYQYIQLDSIKKCKSLTMFWYGSTKTMTWA